MRKKDVIILKYKMMKLIPKSTNTSEPDWESLKEDKNSISRKFDSEIEWVKKTFKKKDVLSIEKMDEISIINHKEGVFIVKIRFNKLFKLIYK